MEVTAEALAYWYLRLNGCLTIRNFIIHPEWRREGPGTDADILAVRFPHRRELVRRPLRDDPWFELFGDRILLIIAEVKRSVCDLNGPWTEPSKENVGKVLSAIGIFRQPKIGLVTRQLYESGLYESRSTVAVLLTFGEQENSKLAERYPAVRQILWQHVASFMYTRFSDYKREKAWHQPWDQFGHGLYELASTARSVDHFARSLIVVA